MVNSKNVFYSSFFQQLVYSLNYYKGDERIKGFIWDLVTPTQDGQQKDYSGHSGKFDEEKN